MHTLEAIKTSKPTRLGIYCFYDKNGRAAKFIDVFLAELSKYVTDLVVVANGACSSQAKTMFSQYTDHIIVRENVGLDAAAYKQAMLELGWKKLQEYDEVICLNDTVMGPVYPFSEMFSKMDAKPLDFWGITAYEGGTFADEEVPTHLQAYWHAYRRSLVSSKEFQHYWEEMPIMTNYAEVTHKHEMYFTPHFEELGFTWSSYIDSRDYADLTSYALLYDPKTLIEQARCPIFKRRSFFVDYDAYFDQTAGQPALELYDCINKHTAYDADLIWDALLPSYNVADLRKAMHLDYVLPYAARNARKNNMLKSAFIFHISWICWTLLLPIFVIFLTQLICISQPLRTKFGYYATISIVITSLGKSHSYRFKTEEEMFLRYSLGREMWCSMEITMSLVLLMIKSQSKTKKTVITVVKRKASHTNYCKIH